MSGWILRLLPVNEGWFLTVTVKGREDEDLAALTLPLHFPPPNDRQIEGWHFRNADNTGPNDGGVNAPQNLREFIFSPIVGRGIDGDANTVTPADIEKVQAFGRGWLFIESYRLSPVRMGERASFETITFSACLTSPTS
jgi:hypothetical protein